MRIFKNAPGGGFEIVADGKTRKYTSIINLINLMINFLQDGFTVSVDVGREATTSKGLKMVDLNTKTQILGGSKLLKEFVGPNARIDSLRYMASILQKSNMKSILNEGDYQIKFETEEGSGQSNSGSNGSVGSGSNTGGGSTTNPTETIASQVVNVIASTPQLMQQLNPKLFFESSGDFELLGSQNGATIYFHDGQQIDDPHFKLRLKDGNLTFAVVNTSARPVKVYLESQFLMDIVGKNHVMVYGINGLYRSAGLDYPTEAEIMGAIQHKTDELVLNPEKESMIGSAKLVNTASYQIQKSDSFLVVGVPYEGFSNALFLPNVSQNQQVDLTLLIENPQGATLSVSNGGVFYDGVMPLVPNTKTLAKGVYRVVSLFDGTATRHYLLDLKGPKGDTGESFKIIRQNYTVQPGDKKLIAYHAENVLVITVPQNVQQAQFEVYNGSANPLSVVLEGQNDPLAVIPANQRRVADLDIPNGRMEFIGV
ncbi:MAG: hypothetical protein ACK4NY_09280 [Spirosomataceae bacterium]